MLGIPFYGRLSTYYFLYYALLGVLVPYWALFLQARGFSSWQIGVLLAVPHITKLGAPNIWGWLADKTGERVRIIRMGNLLSAIIFPWVFLTYGFWSMVLVLAGYSRSEERRVGGECGCEESVGAGLLKERVSEMV